MSDGQFSSSTSVVNNCSVGKLLWQRYVIIAYSGVENTIEISHTVDHLPNIGSIRTN